jgi:hypothetical protein
MSDAATSGRPLAMGPLLLAAAAAVYAVAVGLAAGDPGSGMLLPVGAVLALALVAYTVARPFAGFLLLVYSCFLLMAFRLPGGNRGVNLFDVVLVPLLVATQFGRARAEARAGDALERGAAHEALRRASDRFGGAAVAYFGLAALSVLVMPFRLGPEAALNSGFAIARAFQGALLFPLGLWWLRDERRIDGVVKTLFAMLAILLVVDTLGVLVGGSSRAGMVWMVNELREPVSSPNEAAAGMLILWALVQARRAVRPRRIHLLLMALVLVLLPMTQSRSGLLAFATYLLLTVRHVRWRWVLATVLLLLVALPLVPAPYWGRLGRSLSFKRGSFELFTFLVRIYGYRTAWRVFLDHPIFGVGYLGFRFVSAQYNELRVVIGQAENYMLETLVGLGVVGLGLLALVLQRLYALGRVVRRQTAPGTFAHELGRLHAPLLTALLVANLTGDNFVGMAGIGQLAVWSALLVRAAHLAARPEGEA